MQSDVYEFYKEEDNDKVWKVDHYVLKDNYEDEEDKYELVIGELLFSFDKKKILNLWKDYPHNFSKEELELFNKEFPYWAEFFKERTEKHS